MDLFVIVLLYIFAAAVFMVTFRRRIGLSGLILKEKAFVYLFVLLLAATWIISVPLIFLVKKK